MRVRVLFIMSWGRSGSTLVDTVLGQLPGFFSAGELQRLWERGVLRHSRCGCGKPVVDCEIWRNVLGQLRGGADLSATARAVEGWRAASLRLRDVPTLAATARGARRPSRALRSYVDMLTDLYPAVARVTGARVVVDSSKRPGEAIALGMVPTVSPFYLLLVRDPRAVALSWLRPKTLTDLDRPVVMRRRGPVDSTLRWYAWNAAADLVGRLGIGPSRTIRYEDFAANPQAHTRGLQAFVGEPQTDGPFLDDRTALIALTHTASGNPSRFVTGEVSIRPDDRWRSELSGARRWLTTAIALPGLVRYGYVGDRRAHALDRAPEAHHRDPLNSPRRSGTFPS
jgi:hypothetical protein